MCGLYCYISIRYLEARVPEPPLELRYRPPPPPPRPPFGEHSTCEAAHREKQRDINDMR